MMPPGTEYFSSNYATARKRFVVAASAAGARLDELRLDATGPEAASLVIDIAWLGATKPARAVIHSSGIHGVEGFAGSAVQLALLSRQIDLPDDAALIFVHCLNPYGMAWLRRVNENNVDLNRNFVRDQAERTGVSDGYRRLEAFLNPPTAPAKDLFFLRAAAYVLRYGRRSLTQAIAEGQYEYPRGLFYGGKSLEQGPSLYLAWLRDHLVSVRKVFAIDVHSGLGKWGQESLFPTTGATDPQRLSEKLKRPLVSDPAASGAYRIRGLLSEVFEMLDPRPEWEFVLQEFGTYPGVSVLHTLREENRWHHFGNGSLDHAVKRRMSEDFAPASPEWRRSVVERGVSFAEAVTAYLFG